MWISNPDSGDIFFGILTSQALWNPLAKCKLSGTICLAKAISPLEVSQARGSFGHVWCLVLSFQDAPWANLKVSYGLLLGDPLGGLAVRAGCCLV